MKATPPQWRSTRSRALPNCPHYSVSIHTKYSEVKMKQK